MTQHISAIPDIYRAAIQRAMERGKIMSWHVGEDDTLYVRPTGPLVTELSIRQDSIEAFVLGLMVGDQ